MGETFSVPPPLYQCRLCRLQQPRPGGKERIRFRYRDPEVCRLSYTTWTGGSPEEEPEQHERAHADEGAHDDRVAIPARVDHSEERIQRGYLSYRGV